MRYAYTAHVITSASSAAIFAGKPNKVCRTKREAMDRLYFEADRRERFARGWLDHLENAPWEEAIFRADIQACVQVRGQLASKLYDCARSTDLPDVSAGIGHAYIRLRVTREAI